MMLGIGLGVNKARRPPVRVPSWVPPHLRRGIFIDFASGRYWDGASYDPAKKIVDIWSGGYVETAGGLAQKAQDALALGDLGLQTVPTRTRKGNRSPVRPRNWDHTGEPELTELAQEGAFFPVRLTRGAASQTYMRIGPSGMAVSASYAMPFKFRYRAGTVAQLRIAARNNTVGKQSQIEGVPGALAKNAAGTAAVFTNLINRKLPNGDFEIAGTCTWLDASTSAELRIGPVNPAVGDTLTVLGGQVTDGGFPAQWIANDVTTEVTVTGNRQVIDLTGRLDLGVAGFIGLDLLEPSGAASSRVLEFNNGADSTTRLSIGQGGGAIRLTVVAQTVTEAALDLGAWSPGEKKLAFAFGPNFAAGRLVGGAQVTDTAATYPTGASRLAIGGVGYGASDNTYQFTRKLGLTFGPVDQAAFDAAYALAAGA